MAIPDGYFALVGGVLAGLEYFEKEIPNKDPQQANMRVFIGKKLLSFKHSETDSISTNNKLKTIALDRETGELPLSWSTGHSYFYLLNVEVLCQRTPETYQAWQLKMFNAIMGGYRSLKADYDDAKASASGIFSIEGRNPARNREIEQEELKKWSIELFTGQKFAAFNAMKHSVAPFDFPEFNDLEAIHQGRFIQFLEQAFEWRNMTYQFYPYFWGKKDRWPQAVKFDDPDPLFTKFLQAGAARVIVPVRPGFEKLICHYLSSGGEIWQGKDAPQLEDDLYLSILDELSNIDSNPEGEPWEIRIPTSLVMLQKNEGGLPDEGLPCFRDEILGSGD